MAARFLVISFQRSGLNWLRYCTEHFTGERTPGRPQLMAEGPAFFDRAHDVRRQAKRSDYAGLYGKSGAEVYERVALLLRHPFDCFISHYLGRAGVAFRKGLAHFEVYAANINEFDRLTRGTKRVFYFDEFVNNERGTREFLRFLEVNVDARPHDFAEMSESSRAWYRGYHGLMAEKDRPQLNAKERAAIHRMLQRELGEKFQRYLGRFALDE